ncbi:MAG: hypothetical protein FD152_4013 [Xanthobacteraceae bacterium]|nr:MAG: hypothetical protein FD152_4013 [Xanthobacteraceae bacterium]
MKEIARYACCAPEAAQPNPRTFDAPNIGAPLLAIGPELVRVPAGRRYVEAAYHEAGHAVVAHVLGASPRFATIDNSPVVVFGSLATLSAQERVAIDLAGDLAERWACRWAHCNTDEEWRAKIARVRDCLGGRCDDCNASRQALVECAFNDAAAIAWLRRVADAVLHMVRTRPIWGAICSVAEDLKTSGTLDGAEISRRVIDVVKPADANHWKGLLS